MNKPEVRIECPDNDCSISHRLMEGYQGMEYWCPNPDCGIGLRITENLELAVLKDEKGETERRGKIFPLEPSIKPTPY